jgi:hypothetical protein
LPLKRRAWGTTRVRQENRDMRAEESLPQQAEPAVLEYRTPSIQGYPRVLAERGSIARAWAFVFAGIALGLTLVGVPTQYNADALSGRDIIGGLLIFGSWGAALLGMVWALISLFQSKGRRGLVALIACAAVVGFSYWLAVKYPSHVLFQGVKG